MRIEAFLTAIEISVIIKQLADWCRTVSAGAIILGILNPAILGNFELTRKALWEVGLPGLALCLALSIIGAKLESRKTTKKGA